MRQSRPYPRAVITPKGARALRRGHPWVYAAEVRRLEPSLGDGRIACNGDVVDVFEENGTWQGCGLLSEQSVIRIRMVSRNANDRIDEPFWHRRIAWAWQHRLTTLGARAHCGCEPDTTCCRVIFSEADGLPGLVVDKYEDVLVAQVGTIGMDLLRPTLYPILLDVLRQSGHAIRGIYERNDGAVREKEGLPRVQGWWQAANANGSLSTRLEVRENGIRYGLDLENSQKTGFFLDQKYNRMAVRNIAWNHRVLDCFCHVGPFGLNALAGGAKAVRFVDVSQTALDLARQNVALNGFNLMGDDPSISFERADVLEYLPRLRNKRAMREDGGPFDLIVLDPPAFTKSRSTVRHAQRGYGRSMNRRCTYCREADILPPAVVLTS